MAGFKRTWALGICLGTIGGACLVGGFALLGWRLLSPDDAMILPPHLVGTPPPTPTPGVLGTPVAPPPPAPFAVAILPVSELLSSTPTKQPVSPGPATATSVVPSPPATRFPTPSASAAVGSATRPATRTAMVFTPAPTPTVTTTPTIAPSGEPPLRLRIPRIGLDVPVVPVGQHPLTLNGQLYSQWDVPAARVAGWHQTSAPLGVPGNTVLNGHHNIAGEVFRYLPALKPGDLITLESATRRYHYVVAQTMTLAEEGQPLEARIENARWILPTTDERVTLITCWPYTSNTHRLLVIALPLWQVVPPGDIP